MKYNVFYGGTATCPIQIDVTSFSDSVRKTIDGLGELSQITDCGRGKIYQYCSYCGVKNNKQYGNCDHCGAPL